MSQMCQICQILSDYCAIRNIMVTLKVGNGSARDAPGVMTFASFTSLISVKILNILRQMASTVFYYINVCTVTLS